MAFLDCQVLKETSVPWDLQDPLEDQEAQEGPVVQVLKASLDSQVEMVLQVVPAPKERGATLVSKVPQEPVYHQEPSREPKETLDFQAPRVFPDKKESLESPETQESPAETDAQECPDHQVRKETPASRGVQAVQEVQDQKATWEKWDSQDHRD